MKALAPSLLLTLVFASAAFGVNVPADFALAVAPAPPTESLVVGSLQSLAADRCVLSFVLQVTADAGGGNDDFRLEVYDEGQLIRVAQLEVPANGALYLLPGSLSLPPISQATPGIGVVLVDDTVLDIEDPVAASCAPYEVPAVGHPGLAGLAALLVVAGLVAVRRRAAHA